MTTSSKLNPLSLADVKADASSFSGNALEPAAYMIQSAAWPHLMLGFRDGVEKVGNPVDTIPAFHGIGPVWNVEASPAGSATTFTIQSKAGIFQHVENFADRHADIGDRNEGIIGSATATVFKIVLPQEAYPNLYSFSNSCVPSIQVGDGEFAVQAVSGAGADQIVLRPYDKQDTRQLWVFTSGRKA
ncbi:hypothetical protein PLEOSDRAFT_166868 [Pleurotus ostreatus PC15]|uniref:Uncharacterized protein n=1 Tax=Pleurotus ostreatus (strain PC15) TaxID=1137138 RepID=A0A067NL55_PLEO1|nr:hypothetical protein PLEOSDRAFT_166868 [Pleurotus ostreatus PC15]